MQRPDWQLSRNGLFWVLFAFITVVTLHVDHLPPWVTAVAGICILWRVLEYRGVVSFPPWPLKAILGAGCVAGLVLVYPSLLGLEPMLSMLIAGFGLKLLESQKYCSGFFKVKTPIARNLYNFRFITNCLEIKSGLKHRGRLTEGKSFKHVGLSIEYKVLSIGYSKDRSRS